MISSNIQTEGATTRKEKSAGSVLMRLRTNKNISINDVSRSTYISENAILALESNNLQFFQTRINAEGIAVKYAKHLGLTDVEYIAALVRRDYLINLPETTHLYDTLPSSNMRKFDFWRIGGMLAVFVAVIYFGFQIYAYLLPPKITITEPSAKSFARVEKVRVEGNIDEESQITINGTHANVDDGGNFFADVKLKPGKNDIVLVVTGVNGRKAMKTIIITNN